MITSGDSINVFHFVLWFAFAGFGGKLGWGAVQDHFDIKAQKNREGD